MDYLGQMRLARRDFDYGEKDYLIGGNRESQLNKNNRRSFGKSRELIAITKIRYNCSNVILKMTRYVCKKKIVDTNVKTF